MTPEEISDNDLLSKIQSGDQNSFNQLVERHAKRFYHVAYRLVQHEQEAEDMVQNAFLKLWVEPGKWNPHKGVLFTTWFYRVVTNLCLDFLRKNRPLAMAEGMDVEDERENADEMIDSNRKTRIIDECLKTLPERQKIALTLCFFEGLSNKAAAKIMEIHLKALQSLIVRAKSGMKICVAEKGVA